MGTIFVDRLSDALEARVFSKVKFRENQIPRYLYHYTKKEGFEGITKQNRLRATSASEAQKNDEDEIRFGCNLFGRLINDRIANGGVSKFTLALLESLKSHVQERIPSIFLTSFCTLSDDQKMYKTFGDYCIRFSVDHKNAVGLIAPKGLAAGQGFLTELLPATYDAKEQQTALGSLLDPLIETLEDRSLISDFDPSGWSSEMAKFIAFTVSDLALTSITRMKNAEYRRENEWRLVVRPWRLRFSSDPSEADRNCECFIRQGPQKRYVELAPLEPVQPIVSGRVFGLAQNEVALPISTVRVNFHHKDELESARHWLAELDLDSIEVLKRRLSKKVVYRIGGLFRRLF